MRGKTLFGLSTVASVGLVALSLGLFAVYVNYLGEGYDGSWGAVVLGLAWASIFAALVIALASTVGGFLRWRKGR